MKKLFPFIILLSTVTVFAQAPDFKGNWEGRINAGVSMRLAFTFAENEKGLYSGTLKSPDQSPKAVPLDTVYVRKDSIFAAIQKFGISYQGKLTNDSSISGSFVQGVSLPLLLSKVPVIAETRRLQTPTAPFPYNIKEVVYSGTNDIKYAGTLTWPGIEPGTNYIKAPVYPAILLISGSGPQDRDETILLHKPFAIIADYLTRKGFAVLRVDDRGAGKTTGDFSTATSKDFVDDVNAGINFLKKDEAIDTAKIGLLGHSEGGMIAPVVASSRKDIKYIVLLAGPGIPIVQLMGEQIKAVTLSSGESMDIANASQQLSKIVIDALNKNKDTLYARTAIMKAVERWSSNQPGNLLDRLHLTDKLSRSGYVKAQLEAYSSSWFKYFLSFDPSPYLQKLSCPVLALNGSKDVQVLATSNLKGIEESLKKSQSKSYMIKELPGLNHLFQSCKSCTVAEYGQLEESFSPAALKVIGDWLVQQSTSLN